VGQRAGSRRWTTSFTQLVANGLSEVDAFLFGRRTYDNSSRDWPKVTDPDEPVGWQAERLAEVRGLAKPGEG
jgi:hypothetical protein